MPISNELIDELLKDCHAPQDLLGERGLLKELTKRLAERVMEAVKAWQKRPLEALYPIVYLDCIFVKSQDSGVVINKSIYLALGINIHGEKELLGLWIAKSEGAKFWLSVMTELKNRGLKIFSLRAVRV